MVAKVSLIRNVRIHKSRPMVSVKRASTTIKKMAIFNQLRLLVASAGRVAAKAMNVKIPLPIPAAKKEIVSFLEASLSLHIRISLLT